MKRLVSFRYRSLLSVLLLSISPSASVNASASAMVINEKKSEDGVQHVQELSSEDESESKGVEVINALVCCQKT